MNYMYSEGSNKNMKIVRQRDFKDCGVCSLLSIVRYYHGDIPLEQMRIDANVTREGTSALNLILAAEKYGFDAQGMHYDNLDDIKTLPAIVHLKMDNYTHFVVIYKISKDKVVLMDPAKGKVVLFKSEFLKKWTNVVIVFYPKRKITVLKNDNSLVKLLIKIIILEKKLFFQILFVSIFLVIFTIIGSYYFKVLIDAISMNQYLGYLKILVLLFFITLLFKLLFQFIRGKLECYLNKNIDVYLNSDFLNHLFNLPLDVLTSRTSGEIISRVNELASIKNLWTNLFITCVLDFLLMLISIPLLISINSSLFLILFLTIIIYLIIGVISSKLIYKKAMRNIEYETTFNTALLEDIKMINSIKNLNITGSRLNNIEYKLSNYINDTFKLSLFLNKENSIKELVYELGFFVINTLGFYLVLKKTLSITSLVTFNTLLMFFIDPIKNCINALPKYNFLKASFVKVNDFLNIKEEKLDKSDNLEKYDIKINNLSYAYNHVNKVIDNLSCYIKEGSFVRVSGPSGVGKSTICKILLKFLNGYDGSITIGGINIKDLSINTIRNSITYINQEEHIVTASIKDNILLNRSVDNNLYKQVLDICRIEDIVKKKPLRYETTISDYANNISGGEKQRIILARALLKDSKILILDEALSEVDGNLERSIIKDIKKFYKTKTILYITHKNNIKGYTESISLGGINELS